MSIKFVFSACLFVGAITSLFGGDTKILINTMPKSGSMYLWSVMGATLQPLRYYSHRISDSKFARDRLHTCCILQHDHFIAQEHIDASPFNLRVLKAYLPKFLLHLRDPRQVVLSWLFYIEKNRSPELWSNEITPPKSYYLYSLEEKINWQIDHFLPALVTWTQEWMDAIDSNQYTILVTTYEEMLQDQRSFFTKIFDFFNFTPDEYTLPNVDSTPTAEQHHFRKGMTNEWETVMNQSQIDRMHAIIPFQMLVRFGWEKKDR